jgi:hypothetical protein
MINTADQCPLGMGCQQPNTAKVSVPVSQVRQRFRRPPPRDRRFSVLTEGSEVADNASRMTLRCWCMIAPKDCAIKANVSRPAQS